MTRLNVYAGLSGMFLITDPSSQLSQTFDIKHDIPLLIQDKSFNKDGSIYYPETSGSQSLPAWSPVFFGTIMVVNGKAWPSMKV